MKKLKKNNIGAGSINMYAKAGDNNVSSEIRTENTIVHFSKHIMDDKNFIANQNIHPAAENKFPLSWEFVS